MQKKENKESTHWEEKSGNAVGRVVAK